MTRTVPARWLTASFVAALAAVLLVAPAAGQKDKKKAKSTLTFPPKLPDDKKVLSDTSKSFLEAPSTIDKDVAVAKTAPTVDFLYYPGQTYEGKPWSNWGDSLAVDGKYYASIGDHLAPQGNAFVYEYDPAKKTFRQLVDLKKTLNLPEGHYVPGKIHSRLDLGKDGFLYFSTHRGSTRVTTDKYHYKGDWILRVRPSDAKCEVVAQGPVPKHCIPTSVLDPERLIFYGGTAAGDVTDKDVRFFAYDVEKKKVLHDCSGGPPRYLIFAKSTGRVYWVPGGGGDAVGPLMRYDPKKGGAPVKIDATIGLRAATQETPQGYVYTVARGEKGSGGSTLYAFNVKTEVVTKLGPAQVGTQSYVTSIDADPTGRYLYYVPGAHGGSEKDGSAVVQYDVKTKKRKVIAFLHPFYKDKVGATLAGTFSTAVDPRGDKVYVTWNVRRAGEKNWDCCALTVIHVPESERKP